MTKARTLADMISDGVIGTTELADDVITPVKLDETGNYTVAQLSVGDDTSGIVNMKGGSGTSSQIRFFDGGTGRARIGVPTGQTYLSLSGTDTLTADVIVDNSGRLLVGKTNASHSVAGGAIFEDGRIYSTVAGEFTFTANRLNSDGDIIRVQKDTTTVGNISTNAGAFVLKGASTSAPVQLQTHDGNEDIEVDPDGFIKMETAGSERLRIDSSGQIGISGSTASFDTTGTVNGLQLYYESDSGIATIGSYSSGGGTAIDFRANTGGNAADQLALRIGSNYVTVNPDENDHDFIVKSDNNANMLRVDGGTNTVGVGNSSPGNNATHLAIGSAMSGTTKPTVHIGDTTNGGKLSIRGLAPTIFFDQTGGNDAKLLTDSAGLQLLDGSLTSEGYRYAEFNRSGLELRNDGDCTLIINADTDNVDETHNPRILLRQDGTADHLVIGLAGSNNDGMTGTTSNSAYINAATGGPNELYLGTNNTVGLKIDINQYVTTPKRPYFRAKRNSNLSWGNATLSWGTELEDNGNNFNGTKFTAPVAGVYVFHLQLTILGGTTGQDDTMYWYFYKNGGAYQTMQDNWSYRLGTAGNGVEMNIAATALVPMSANDYVDFRTSGISHTGGVVHSSSYFSGYLLG